MAIGWGIVGLGLWADRSVAPALRQSKDTRLVGVVSRDIERAGRFAAYHGFEQAYDSLDALLANPDLDVIYIATPNNLHAEAAIAAAERGIHWLCAAAMAPTDADCQAMVEAAARHNVRMGMDFQTRYLPAFQALKQTMASGTLGEIVSARLQIAFGDRARPGGNRQRQAWDVAAAGFEAGQPARRAPGRGWKRDPAIAGAGILSGRGMFGTDMLRFLFGEAREVTAISDVETAEDGLETFVVASIRFDSGITVSYDTAEGERMPFPDNAVTVYGSKGTATARGLQTTHSDGSLTVETETGRHVREFHGQNMYQAEIEAFNRSIEEGAEPNPSALDGRRERQLAMAIREAARKHTAVRLV